MKLSKLRSKSQLTEAALGFGLGAVGGCILGATEDPVDRILSVMTASGPLKPVIEEARIMGPLGLGTLMGATALTTAMTSVIAGVILAAVVASVFVAMRSCSTSYADSAGLWASAGVAGILGTTLSGATFGKVIEWIVKTYDMVGLLWALVLFTVLKPPLSVLFQLVWNKGEVCCALGLEVMARDREDIEITEWQQRQRVALQIEERIFSMENGGNTMDNKMRWFTEKKEREEIERRKFENKEAEIQQRTIHEWISTVLVKHVDFLAFSGMPMAVVSIVTTVLGLFGYGSNQAVFIVLLALVALIALFLLQFSDFKFWMLLGCIGMFATFIIAMLTLHAEQLVVTTAMKMRRAGHNQSKELIGAQMNFQSSLEAVSTSFFGAKLCQLGLGATVGGTLVRRAAGEVKIIVGAASMAGILLAGIEGLATVLGNGGMAGALLGVVGAAGVSVGATAAAATRWSSWSGTVGTVGGLILGALGMGKWHTVNIGLQVPVAFVFAMSNPF
ncbi:uncharacterized protein LOC124867930 [Girardinichthys multiradiatus]|uniref:uncharacterized protein LOC124867930 n=1 Tax=Girardinichthys multiradiatus TaxID=208333 RepID=UPI001FAC3968|nr:uncharacterized protein LOC124867930 [Girardinichthys multiradiatus]